MSDEQIALSKKYLAVPIYLIPLDSDRWALLSGHTERRFIASGTLAELEAHIPGLTPAATRPVWNKPQPRKGKPKLDAAQLTNLLKGLKV